MSVEIKSTSHLKFATLRNVDGIEFWELPVLPPIPQTDADITKRVQQYARTDQVGWAAFKDDVLGWVIHQANQHFFPPRDMAPGSVVRFPPAEQLRAYLQAQLAERARKRK